LKSKFGKFRAPAKKICPTKKIRPVPKIEKRSKCQISQNEYHVLGSTRGSQYPLLLQKPKTKTPKKGPKKGRFSDSVGEGPPSF